MNGLNLVILIFLFIYIGKIFLDLGYKLFDNIIAKELSAKDKIKVFLIIFPFLLILDFSLAAIYTEILKIL